MADVRFTVRVKDSKVALDVNAIIALLIESIDKALEGQETGQVFFSYEKENVKR